MERLHGLIPRMKTVQISAAAISTMSAKGTWPTMGTSSILMKKLWWSSGDWRSDSVISKSTVKVKSRKCKKKSKSLESQKSTISTTIVKTMWAWREKSLLTIWRRAERSCSTMSGSTTREQRHGNGSNQTITLILICTSSSLLRDTGILGRM